VRRRAAAAAAGLLALAALAAVRSGGGGPPLYDGICAPPSYAVLGSTPGPASASATYSSAELATTQELATPPQIAPQAQVIVGSGTFSPAAGASTVTLTITPVKPPATRPAGSIDGNVYDVEATSSGKPVAVAADHPVTIALESTSSGGPTLTLEHLAGGRWTALKTFPSGCGSTFDAAAPSLGLFALVAQSGSSGGGGGSGGGSGPSILLILVIVVVVLALVIGAVRASRSRGGGGGRRGSARRR
jgi:hypothetical protein